MFKFVIVSMLIEGFMLQQLSSSTNATAKPLISGILSKFHQSDYKIIFERVELLRKNNKTTAGVHFHTFKYNRTTAGLNGSIILTVDVGYDVEIIAQAYRFASNEYRLFPLRFQVNLCQVLSTSAMGFDKISTFGNVKCPFLKDKPYYFYNWTPDENNFPPFIPSGSYMIEAQFMYHSMELFVTRCYGTIDRPIPWVK